MRESPPYTDANGERISTTTASVYRPYESLRTTHAEASTWVQVDLGADYAIDAVRLSPSNVCLIPGNGFPLRFRIDCSVNEEFQSSEPIADRTDADYPDPADRVLVFRAQGAIARYVRLTASKLRERKRPKLPVEFPTAEPVFLLALSKMEVLSSGLDVAVGRRVQVDPVLGSLENAQQLTRSPRPQGEGVITDNPNNVTAPFTWRPPAPRATYAQRSVTLDGGLFHQAMLNNIDYLISDVSIDDLLREFRIRAGKPLPTCKNRPHPFWDEDLGGSSAGRFLMGAGNTLRWMEHAQMRSHLNYIVEAICDCRDANGYILGYPANAIFTSEREPYARAWTTHGLIDAGYCGNETAFELLRGHYDWYNKSNHLPELLRRCSQGSQGMVANTRLYFTPVGQPADIHVLQRYFQENYWMEGLSRRNPEMIWQYPYDRSHCYLLTTLEAYMDLYRATGDSRYLDAVDGGWDLYREHWQNTGGSISIIETERCPPGSNQLYAWLGETCGSAFWILLNHRLHSIRPDDERYVAEIEKTIYNIILANQDGPRGFRYHTFLLGHKGPAYRVGTCCEGQGTRIIGSLPEYIYSIAPDGLYINLFEPSSIAWTHSGNGIRVTMHTTFPRAGVVNVGITTSSPQRLKLHVRIPSWTQETVEVKVNGTLTARGQPGSYLTLDRIWRDADEISMTLSMALKLTRYTGTDQIASRVRLCLEHGPLLMAALGAADRQLVIPLAAGQPADILARLEPIHENRHFVLTGSTDLYGKEIRFVPYFEVSDQHFSCFPTVESRVGIFS